MVSVFCFEDDKIVAGMAEVFGNVRSAETGLVAERGLAEGELTLNATFHGVPT